MQTELVLLGIVAVVAVGVVVTRSRRRPTAHGWQYADHVKVSVRINGNDIDIDVDPCTAEVRRGQELDWEHDADSLEIIPKNDWPYTRRPDHAGKGQPARSGPMRPGAAPHRRYAYTIVAKKGNHTIRLDPDIIIRDGPIM